MHETKCAWKSKEAGDAWNLKNILRNALDNRWSHLTKWTMWHITSKVHHHVPSMPDIKLQVANAPASKLACGLIWAKGNLHILQGSWDRKITLNYLCGTQCNYQSLTGVKQKGQSQWRSYVMLCCLMAWKMGCGCSVFFPSHLEKHGQRNHGRGQSLNDL